MAEKIDRADTEQTAAEEKLNKEPVADGTASKKAKDSAKDGLAKSPRKAKSTVTDTADSGAENAQGADADASASSDGKARSSKGKRNGTGAKRSTSGKTKSGSSAKTADGNGKSKSQSGGAKGGSRSSGAKKRAGAKTAEKSEHISLIPEESSAPIFTEFELSDDTDAKKIELEAISSLPVAEVEPELLIYDNGEIEDTHESPEEAARYESYLRDFKATMAEMLRNAKSVGTVAEEDLSDNDELAAMSDAIVTDNESDVVGVADGADADAESDVVEATDEAYADAESDVVGVADGADADAESDVVEATDAANSNEDGSDDEVNLDKAGDDDATIDEADADTEDVAEAKKDDTTDETNDAVNDSDDAVNDSDDTVTDDEFGGEISRERRNEGFDPLSTISLLEYVPSLLGEEPEQDGDSEEASEENDSSAEEDSDGDEILSEISEDDGEEEEYYEPEQLAMSFSDGNHDEEAPDKHTYDPKKPRGVDSLFDMIELFVLTFVAIMVITTFFFRHSVVDGRSMENTLFDGDVVIISNFFYTPERGDIVVLDDRTAHDGALVKRVIGIAGDIVSVRRDGSIYVNGRLINENYVYETDTSHIYNEKTWNVGEGQIFVLGDHRDISDDSENFGPVNADTVLGKVLFRLLPFSSFGGVD